MPRLQQPTGDGILMQPRDVPVEFVAGGGADVLGAVRGGRVQEVGFNVQDMR